MSCTPVKTPHGTAIVCDRKRKRPPRCACGKPATMLCDWKLGMVDNVSQTCSAPVCAACALEVTKDKHLCPAHQGAYALWLDARKNDDR
jgi:hypothetical protein